jgi:chemotaxis protein methyltransferase CheR
MTADWQNIITYVRQARGLDLTRYQSQFIEQQVQQRMQICGVRSMADYVAFLRTTPAEMQALLHALLIRFSLFCRTPLVFETFFATILPQYSALKRAAGNLTWRVWSAGCASGEEPYSLAMLFQEWRLTEQIPWDVQIFATDVDAQSLERAQIGLYNADHLQNVKYGWLQKYFQREHQFWRVKPEIRALVAFSRYDLLDASTYVPPETIFGNFDLVFCRNVLIYFDEPTRAQLYRKLWRALTANGLLVLGEAEMLLEAQGLPEPFTPIAESCKIYQKQAKPLSGNVL